MAPGADAVRVEVSVRPVAGLATHAGGVPIVDAVRVWNIGSERLLGARWSAALEAPTAARVQTVSIDIPPLHPGESVVVAPIQIALPVEALVALVEPAAGQLAWKLERRDPHRASGASHVLADGAAAVSLLPWDAWPGDRAPAGVLAAFVLPSDPVVATIVRRAQARPGGAEPVGDPAGPVSPGGAARFERIHDAVRALGLRRVELSVDAAAAGARLRLPDAMLRTQRANDIELTLLYAACAERMGLAPLIIAGEHRTMPGLWLADDRFPEGIVLDAGRVRSAAFAGQLIVLDPIDAGGRRTWPDALEAGRAALDDASFRFAVDLRAARDDGWAPLPARPRLELRDDGTARPIVREILAEAATLPAAVPTSPAGAQPRSAAPKPVDEPVAARFRQWKERLLDLSLRNRLLAFRMGARTTVPLEVPDLPRLVEQLSADAAIEVVPMPPPTAGPEGLPDVISFAADADDIGADGDPTRTLPAFSELETEPALKPPAEPTEEIAEPTATTRTLPPFASDDAPAERDPLDDPTSEIPDRPHPALRGVDPAEARIAGRRLAALDRRMVEAPFDATELMAHAVALDRAARIDLEEGGANTLFLAVGFLHWSELGPNTEPQRIAPLLLIPVVLELQRSARRVRFRRASDDAIANVTLIEKLRRDFDLDLSKIAVESDEGGGLDTAAVLAAARAAISPMRRWRIEERAALGQLLFTKFLVWRDLEDNADWLLDSSVVQHIARRTGVAYPNPVDASDPATLDDLVPPSALPLVLDADSTQMSAIHSALSGRSFVLQGPPGTGKSQTITNLVAAAIATGRTVLVVAEKMAALDVVHRRLKDAGLGDFCLELHSHKANKRQVVGALAATLRREGSGALPPWDARSAEVAEARARLNAYVRALHVARPLGATFRAITGRLLGDAGPVFPLELPQLTALPEDRLRAMLEQVARFATAAAEVEPVASHPWGDTRIRQWSAAGEQAVLGKLAKATEATDGVGQAGAALAEILEVEPPRSAARLRDLARLGAMLAEGALPPAAVDPARSARFAARVTDFTERYATWQARSRAVAMRWHPAIYRADLDRLSARFGTWASTWFVWAFVMLFRPRRELRSHARRDLPDNRTIASDLAVALQVERAREGLQNERKQLLTDTAGTWASGEPDELRTLVERAERVRTEVRRVKLGGTGGAERALGWVDPALPADRRKLLQRRVTEATRALERWKSTVDTMYAAVGHVEPTGDVDPEAGDRGLEEVRARLVRWSEGTPRFRAWAMYGEAAAAMDDIDLGPLARAHRSGAIAAADLVAVAERSLLRRWVEAVRDREDALRGFSGPEHHRQVLRFRQLDGQQLELAKRQVLWSLDQRLPRVSGEIADASEPGILLREAAKRTRQRSIRRLFSEIPNLLGRLKPCLLMSPMSVAQYLPAGGRRFDLVVFDEASQIGTHDAIGALARGAQVVVVGDRRQLPPTTFFQRQASDEVPDDNDFDELESILDEAVAAGLPEQMLGWHYRSRHESLIRFSNDHYYGGRLAVFPAARGRVGDLGIAWHPVPNGVYDKSRTRTNRAEARALVDHLVASLRATQPGERTFGVVTFSQSQQALVSDMLDERRRLQPAIEPHFAGIDEPVFVKNLENVQGDERDEILFSIGYGPDERGRLWMNFGPLNREGGERRLNVAVTRARRQLRVFSTLTHDQIDLARTRARGARHLKDFLRYAAELGSPSTTRPPSRDFATAFERDVYEALRERGHAVDVAVGCGAYRIDLAVLDPERPGEYVLGIELDGEAYASGATARDRDRLRPEVLEGLGWRLHRVWSTDWWYDRAREITRLERALEDALSGEPWVDDEPTDPGEDAKARAEAAEADDATGEEIPAAAGGLRGVEAYVVAAVEPVSDDPKSLYDADQLPELRRVLQQVLDAEAPIHLAELTRRVGAAFALSKVTAKAQKRVGSVAKKLSPPAAVHGSFVWPAGVEPETYARVRGATADGTTRDPEHIPVEEIARAARLVLNDNLAMPHADLVRETARVFGISRLGRKIADAMGAGIALLVEQGGAEVQEDRVVGR